MLDRDQTFWMLVVSAVSTKMLAIRPKTFLAGLAYVAAAVLTAYTGTDVLMHYLRVPEIGRPLVIVLLALTGENLLRQLMLLTSDLTYLQKLVGLWRGK